MSHADVAAVPPPLVAEHLPDDPAVLKDMILELLATLQERNRDNEALRHRLDLLLRRLYGPRSERVDPRQRSLFPEDEPGQDPPTAAAPIEAAAETKPRRQCRPHGRRRLPEHLPRLPQHHVLSEAERVCSLCGRLRGEIGTDKSEQLDYKPAALFVIEHVVHKYACPCCSKTRPEGEAMPRPEPTPTPESGTSPAAPQTASAPPPCAGVVIAAAKPAAPIAKGLPGPGLLAHLIVSKYVDHLPLHRLERIYERQGLFLPRSTLCDWLLACGQRLRPL
jgi:transposase